MSRKAVLPPVDASPDEIAEAIFTFDPEAPPFPEGHGQAPVLAPFIQHGATM